MDCTEMRLVLELPLRDVRLFTRRIIEVGVQYNRFIGAFMLMIEIRELRRAEADAFLARIYRECYHSQGKALKPCISTHIDTQISS